jgi:carboxymethylenebutenolidase
MPERWDTLEVDGDMRCYVAIPAGAGPFRAVVVAQHAGGVDQFIQTMTDRFAEAGFVAIAPDLYHREDPNSGDDAMRRMTRLRDANIERDMKAAVAHLKTMVEVRADGIGVTGFCMGGRVAYMMAARAPELKAAVVFYGGHIMNAWGEGPAPFDQSAAIGCPVLGLFGKLDGNPNPEDVAKIDAELARLGKVHQFQSYDGVGHAFMSEGRPGYVPETAANAWAKCVAWFGRYLA